MDVLKLLKSFEELVYEALAWLVLLPWTLLRAVASPRRMTRYAREELDREGEDRFDRAVSPPLALILCVLLAHAIDLALRRAPVAVTTDGTLAGVVLASEQNLLLYRTVAFGVWALAGALGLTWLVGGTLGRRSLRTPFHEQCYLVAPFALAVSVGVSMLALGGTAPLLGGVGLVLVATAWFWAVQVDWLRHRAGRGLWRAALAGSAVLVAGAVVNTAIGHVLTGAPVVG